jgi:uncharacterized protein (DUF2252 family)
LLDRFAPLATRIAAGKGRRRVLSRLAQAEWQPPRHRPDPIALLEAGGRGRLPEILPIRWGRMAASPFGFFRGAAAIMAADLATLPTSGIGVQICGDAHVRNLGAYAAPDGQLVFDINDFDESVHGPWEWDLKRLATSFVLAGREAGERDRACARTVELLVRSYREAMTEFARMPAVLLFRQGLHHFTGPVGRVLRKAERATPEHNRQRLTVGTGERRRFIRRPPLLVPVSTAAARKVLGSVRSYRETVSEDRQLVLDAYCPEDVAFKAVGVGSLGLRDYVVLCRGAAPRDLLFLQVKEEPASCWAPYANQAGHVENQGHRVARAQHQIQTMSDPFLGWTRIDGRDFLVRQLSDHKAAIDASEFKGQAIEQYARVCGRVFAKAHARTGDPGVLAGYFGDSDKLDIAIRRFAIAYADQTSSDHKRLVLAIRQGRVKARRGV